MLLSDYDRYCGRTIPEPDHPLLSVEHVAGDDRTLVYGYTTDRDSVHVYLHTGQIHIVTYRGWAVPSLLSHQAGVAVPAAACVPDKRAYPQWTDAAAANALRELGTPLTFTAWDDPPRDPGAFCAPTHLAWVASNG